MIRDYVALDLETSGLNPSENQIIEIGMAKVCDGEITETYSRLLNPKEKLSQRIVELTGITDEMVAGQPHVSEVIDEIVDEEISVGDYVLTGGELPAMILIDSVSRYIEGVLKEDSTKEESFSEGLLEYPQYTRPEIFNGNKVPEVLLSGHHENIDKWRREQSLKITKKKRPDLFKNIKLSEKDKMILEKYK